MVILKSAFRTQQRLVHRKGWNTIGSALLIDVRKYGVGVGGSGGCGKPEWAKAEKPCNGQDEDARSTDRYLPRYLPACTEVDDGAKDERERGPKHPWVSV